MSINSFLIRYGRMKSSIIITIVSVILALFFSIIISNIMLSYGMYVNMTASITISTLIPLFIAFPISYYTLTLHILLNESKSNIESMYLESKKINGELNQSKYELSQLFDSASIGLFHISKDRVLIKVNQKAADIFGYKSPKEMIGMNMEDFHISKESFDFFGKSYFESLKYGEEVNIEYQLKRKDDSIIWCELSGKILDQNIPSDFSKGVLWVISNIDKRKKLEEYKNETHARLEFALEGATDGLWDWDLLTNDVYYSPKWKQILGYKNDEIENKFSSWEELVDLDGKLEAYEKLEDYLEGKLDKFEIKFHMKHKDGHYVPILARAKKILDKDQKPIRLVGTHFDLTQIEEYEKQQKKQQDIIFQQSKMASMSELIMNIAHHWRQPLSIISTCATSLRVHREFDRLDNELIDNSVKSINDTVQYLSKTIDDFGSFINNEKKEKVFDVRDSIINFLDLINPSIENNKIKIITNLEENLMLFGCPKKITYCLMNLYANSEEVLRKKEIKLIFIDVYKKDSNLLIEFKDNGPGILQENLSRVFEPYFTTKHKSQGTGLGLSIVYDFIVNAMGGNIVVANEEYEYHKKIYTGVKFTISLTLLDTHNQKALNPKG